MTQMTVNALYRKSCHNRHSRHKQQTKERKINLVKWGVFDPMIDIRRWQKGEPSKGISLKYEEAEKLLAVLGAELKNNGNG